SKIYFPRLIIPISSFGSGIVDFLISSVIMIVMMYYYGIAPTPSILIFPFLILVTLIAALGISVILAALTVTYRDVKYIAPFLMQIWMYATPIIYPVSIIPAKWRWVLSLNPMSGVIEGCRSAVFGKPFDWFNLGISAVVSLIFLAVGLVYFKKVESR